MRIRGVNKFSDKTLPLYIASNGDKHKNKKSKNAALGLVLCIIKKEIKYVVNNIML